MYFKIMHLCLPNDTGQLDAVAAFVRVRIPPAIFTETATRQKLFAPSYGALLWMDGWMTCDFKSFSTGFQSYLGDGMLITKGCKQCAPLELMVL